MKYKLSDLFELQMGKTPSRDNTEYWSQPEYPWVSIADLSGAGKYIYATKESISRLAIEESGIKTIPANTVIMSFKLSIGKVSITPIPMYSNEAIMAFIDKGITTIKPEYLYYLLLHRDWDEGTNKAVMGKTLNKATLSDVVIDVHSIEDQDRIVAVLDKVSDIIERYQKQLNTLDILVKARFVEMFGDPVSNPKGWEKRPLSEEAEIRIGPFGSLLHKEDYISDGHALINPSHIINGRIAPDNDLTLTDDKYEELAPYHLIVGDVVMGRRGEMGRCAVVDRPGLLCGTGSLLIRTKGDLSADYIQKIISFPSFKRTIEDMAVGQTMPNLNVPIVSAFQIIKPPKAVQERYYAFVSQVDKSKVVVQKALDEAKLLFESLMQKYFG